MVSAAIGLMSGTSLDGVDGVVFDARNKRLLEHVFVPYDAKLKTACRLASQSAMFSFAAIAELTAEITEHYCRALDLLLNKTPSEIELHVIGAHGQTIHHAPNLRSPYSCQLLDGSVIASSYNKAVICDFRRNDMALGGQGAPLAPVFHRYLFNIEPSTVILNLGGIANITYLDHEFKIRGFDTGPANCLIDEWCQFSQNQPYDEDGQWASTGRLNENLLAALKQHPFFTQMLPKSADKEIFSREWLHTILQGYDEINACDVQRTLAQFTVDSVWEAIHQVNPTCCNLIVCGGGARNTFLMQLFNEKLDWDVVTCDQLGFPAEAIEAMMMAWLADLRIKEIKVDLTTVTGASRPSHLGAVYLP